MPDVTDYMNREEVKAYIKRKYKVNPDYPFSEEYSETAVFRHDDTRKWFALCMEIGSDKIGHASYEYVDVITLKSDPMLIDSIISKEGFHRAYHMNKTHWLTVELNDIVNDKELKDLIDLSFELTDKKRKCSGL